MGSAAECILHGKKLDQQTVAGSPKDDPHRTLDPGNSLPHERWAGLSTPPDRYNSRTGSSIPCNCFLQPLSGAHVLSTAWGGHSSSPRRGRGCGGHGQSPITSQSFQQSLVGLNVTLQS